PDTEENIRIEALPAGPQGEAPSGQRAERAASEAKTFGKAYEGKPDHKRGHTPRRNDEPRHEQRHKRHREAAGGPPPSGTVPGSDKKRRHEHKAADAGRPRRHQAAPSAKPAFGKKPKKNKFRR